MLVLSPRRANNTLARLSQPQHLHSLAMTTDSPPPPADGPTKPLHEPVVSNPPPTLEKREERVAEHVTQLKTVLSHAQRYLLSYEFGISGTVGI